MPIWAHRWSRCQYLWLDALALTVNDGHGDAQRSCFVTGMLTRVFDELTAVPGWSALLGRLPASGRQLAGRAFQPGGQQLTRCRGWRLDKSGGGGDHQPLRYWSLCRPALILGAPRLGGRDVVAAGGVMTFCGDVRRCRTMPSACFSRTVSTPVGSRRRFEGDGLRILRGSGGGGGRATGRPEPSLAAWPSAHGFGCQAAQRGRGFAGRGSYVAPRRPGVNMRTAEIRR